MTVLLSVDDLSVSFQTGRGDAHAVTNLSFDLHAGESLGLVGESGSGKSTVAMAIMGHLARNGVARGRVVRSAKIAMVYQEPMSALNPSLTIGEQLSEVPVYHDGVSWREARTRALAILEEVRIADPDRVLASYPHQLSGGQQQRVVIAMALLAGPSVLLLDEPTTGLDVTIEAAIVDLIASMQATRSMSLLYISHNLGLISQVCDRVAVMYSGEIVEEGSVGEVFRRPRHPYTRGLLRCLPDASSDRWTRPLHPIRGVPAGPFDRSSGCRFGPRCDWFVESDCDAGAIALVDRVRCPRWNEISVQEGQAPGPDAIEGPTAESGSLISVKSLTRHFPLRRRRQTLKALNNASFEIREGRTTAIVGESGSGKSTIARILIGVDSASSGTAEMDGANLADWPVERRPAALHRSLQMVFQNPEDTLNPSFSVGAQITRTVRKLDPSKRGADVRKAVAELLELVRLPQTVAKQKPAQLSGGQKQRVAIARAFAGAPQLVVADEPVSALDVSVSAAVTDLLLDVQRRHGTTMLLISHDLGLVRYVADEVVVVYLGHVMENGSSADVFAPPYHPYTEALLSAVPSVDSGSDRKRTILVGEMPSPIDPPPGCPFCTRCPRKLGDLCEQEAPPEQVTATGHRVFCHIPLETLAEVQTKL